DDDVAPDVMAIAVRPNRHRLGPAEYEAPMRSPPQERGHEQREPEIDVGQWIERQAAHLKRGIITLLERRVAMGGLLGHDGEHQKGEEQDELEQRAVPVSGRLKLAQES